MLLRICRAPRETGVCLHQFSFSFTQTTLLRGISELADLDTAESHAVTVVL